MQFIKDVFINTFESAIRIILMFLNYILISTLPPEQVNLYAYYVAISSLIYIPIFVYLSKLWKEVNKDISLTFPIHITILIFSIPLGLICATIFNQYFIEAFISFVSWGIFSGSGIFYFVNHPKRLYISLIPYTSRIIFLLLVFYMNLLDIRMLFLSSLVLIILYILIIFRLNLDFKFGIVLPQLNLNNIEITIEGILGTIRNSLDQIVLNLSNLPPTLLKSYNISVNPSKVALESTSGGISNVIIKYFLNNQFGILKLFILILWNVFVSFVVLIPILIYTIIFHKENLYLILIFYPWLILHSSYIQIRKYIILNQKYIEALILEFIGILIFLTGALFNSIEYLAVFFLLSNLIPIIIYIYINRSIFKFYIH
jgi:hypothetical protein